MIGRHFITFSGAAKHCFWYNIHSFPHSIYSNMEHNWIFSCIHKKQIWHVPVPSGAHISKYIYLLTVHISMAMMIKLNTEIKTHDRQLQLQFIPESFHVVHRSLFSLCSNINDTWKNLSIFWCALIETTAADGKLRYFCNL